MRSRRRRETVPLSVILSTCDNIDPFEVAAERRGGPRLDGILIKYETDLLSFSFLPSVKFER